ncbi:43993_t:CDS:2, partial [Gigaspora margarita]
MIELIEAQDICEIWQVRLFSNLASHNEQYIIVLDDGSHLCSYMQEIQNDESSNNFAIIEQIRGPDSKKRVQIALNTDTMNEFIGLLYDFIESKSTQADNSLRLDFIKSVTNPYIISYRGQPKNQLHNSLEVDESNSYKISKSNKALKELDVTNKSTCKCSYCNNTGHYANTCELNPKNKKNKHLIRVR